MTNIPVPSNKLQLANNEDGITLSSCTGSNKSAVTPDKI